MFGFCFLLLLFLPLLIFLNSHLAVYFMSPQSMWLSSAQLVLHSTVHFSINLKAVPPGQQICAAIGNICSSKPAYSYRKINNQALNCPESNVSCLPLISDTHFTGSSLTFKYITQYIYIKRKAGLVISRFCFLTFCVLLTVYIPWGISEMDIKEWTEDQNTEK